MANFKLKTITAKAGMNCVVCYKKHEQGAVVPMEFFRTGGRQYSANIVCDGDCLAQLAERTRPATDKFLDKLSIQFN